MSAHKWIVRRKQKCRSVFTIPDGSGNVYTCQGVRRHAHHHGGPNQDGTQRAAWGQRADDAHHPGEAVILKMSTYTAAIRALAAQNQTFITTLTHYANTLPLAEQMRAAVEQLDGPAEAVAEAHRLAQGWLDTAAHLVQCFQDATAEQPPVTRP